MDRVRRGLKWAGVVVALLVLGALLAEFAPLGPLAGGSSDSATLPTAPEAAGEVPVVPVDDPVVATTVQLTSTTLAASTSTSAPLSTIVPVGDPLPLSELALGVDGLGDLVIGDPATVVLGRLVATLGEPDEDSGIVVSSGELGTCPGETVRVVRFGMLAVTTVVDDAGDERFASYRLDSALTEDPASGPLLETISGLAPGDTVADLEGIYADLGVTFFEAPSGTVFELRRPSDGRLLLTGPVTGSDAASTVTGIYSPDQCG